MERIQCAVWSQRRQSLVENFTLITGFQRLSITGGAHTAQQLTLPGYVRLVCLPPYCPELSPIERVWQDLKDALAWLQCSTLERPQDHVAALLRAYVAVTLHALTSDTYLMEAVHAQSA